MHMGSWYLGTLCIMVACVAFASFLILQTPVMEKYPAPISFIALACFSSVTQLPILGAIYERRASSWKLLKIREISSVLYAGIIASALVSAILSWGVYEAGPVLVAAYQPLETVITALFGYIFLKETLPLASILGGVVVVIGLYLLIWGQERELKYRVQPALRHSEGSVPQTGSQSNGSSSLFEVVCPLKVAEDLRSSSTPRCHLAAKQTSIEDENETGLELAVTH
ncbi:hypothetical protein O6H91_18G057300 [Diphasiastrum complanatum]|nr:hypothetical protein O6H91_18G057300 [Diphasiastrum complanatum]